MTTKGSKCIVSNCYEKSDHKSGKCAKHRTVKCELCSTQFTWMSKETNRCSNCRKKKFGERGC